MKNPPQKAPPFLRERIFKVFTKNNVVDLSESLSIINNKASKYFFEKEIFQLSFSVPIKGTTKLFSILVTANECINQEDCNELQNKSGIEIEGYGMRFTILNFVYSFTLQIDQKNSVFIDTASVKNGCIYFNKEIH
ncbi:hypothetical protein [Tenacibaculum halocynthiae]|uniref:hypothetical protein n=1 Tax=Tenacibaculum halocynthiae TaxID=1254437 RepID=UPI003D651BCB